MIESGVPTLIIEACLGFVMGILMRSFSLHIQVLPGVIALYTWVCMTLYMMPLVVITPVMVTAVWYNARWPFVAIAGLFCLFMFWGKGLASRYVHRRDNKMTVVRLRAQVDERRRQRNNQP